MRRPPWRSRRGTVTALIVVAVVVAAVSAVSFWSALRTVTGGAAAARSVSPDALRESCGQAAGAWMATFTDQSAPAGAWAGRMTSLTSPSAVQALSSVDRSGVPAGGVGVVEAAADAVSCDARVHTGDGQVTALLLTVVNGAWLVESWGPPSQESE